MDIHVEKLTKKYDEKTVLDQLNLDVKDFQVMALIGASGSGKSTLLRLIAGMEDFESGRLAINGETLDAVDIHAFRKKVGFVFQDHNLFNHLSVMENLLLVLEKVHKKKRSEIEPVLEKLLDQFGLLEHSHKMPHQLSGGQSQRVSIVRALSIDPDIILLDEPTSSLDPILTYEVLKAVEQLAGQKRDFIIVTHEIGFARQIADYVVFMEEGHIIEHGPAQILDKPSTLALKLFLSKVLTFKAHEEIN